MNKMEEALEETLFVIFNGLWVVKKEEKFPFSWKHKKFCNSTKKNINHVEMCVNMETWLR